MLNSYLLSVLKNLFPLFISTISIERSYLLITLRAAAIAYLTSILKVLKYSSLTRLNMLTELTAYDYPTSKNRFTLNFFLLSVEYNYRLAINVSFSSDIPVPSLTGVYPNSN
jgi:NADH:ubiquinone oxidoreductase subunit C